MIEPLTDFPAQPAGETNRRQTSGVTTRECPVPGIRGTKDSVRWRFKTPEEHTDDEVLARMASLAKADYLGKWGRDRLAEFAAEARKRGLNVDTKGTK